MRVRAHFVAPTCLPFACVAPHPGALLSRQSTAPRLCAFALLLLRHCHLLQVWHRCTRWGYWPEHLVCHWHERLVLAACDRACAWRWCCCEGGEADPIQCTQAQVRVQVLFNGGGSPCQRFVDCRVQQDKPCQGLERLLN